MNQPQVTTQAPLQYVAAVKIGDILYSSWGYDQTNIDFYEVTKGGRAGQMIELRELKTSSTPERGFMTADKVPVFGEGRFAVLMPKSLVPRFNRLIEDLRA